MPNRTERSGLSDEIVRLSDAITSASMWVQNKNVLEGFYVASPMAIGTYSSVAVGRCLARRVPRVKTVPELSKFANA